MGYFLIFENMLPSVLAVRDRCLADGGQIIPSEASLYICGYTGDYYDPDLDSIEANKAGVSEAVIALLEEKNIITKCERMMTIDLRTVKNYTNDFRSVVQLSVLKGEELSVCAAGSIASSLQLPILIPLLQASQPIGSKLSSH